MPIHPPPPPAEAPPAGPDPTLPTCPVPSVPPAPPAPPAPPPGPGSVVFAAVLVGFALKFELPSMFAVDVARTTTGAMLFDAISFPVRLIFEYMYTAGELVGVTVASA